MVAQYTVEWLIPNAGPSVSTFHANMAVNTGPIGQWVANIRAMFAAIAADIPNDVTVTFPAEVRDYDTASGELTGAATVARPADVTGTSAGNWQGGSGARIDWGTAAIRFGRRVRGRTFIVPAGGASFDTGGRINGTSQGRIAAAANAYVSNMAGLATPAVVYSRPSDSHPVGAMFNVTGASVPTLAASLRGRKY